MPWHGKYTHWRLMCVPPCGPVERFCAYWVVRSGVHRIPTRSRFLLYLDVSVPPMEARKVIGEAWARVQLHRQHLPAHPDLISGIAQQWRRVLAVAYCAVPVEGLQGFVVPRSEDDLDFHIDRFREGEGQLVVREPPRSATEVLGWGRYRALVVPPDLEFPELLARALNVEVRRTPR